MILTPELSTPTCSRAGCTRPGLHRIDWRNPRIHPMDRHKTWLACTEHLEHLQGFLETRSFPVRVSKLSDHAAEHPA